MIKNKITQLVFQSVYCTLAFVAFFASLGFFKASFNSEFYVYYTNLSNYICIVFMYVILINTIKCANKKEDSYCNIAPTFKFMCVIMILVTFLVYNILLAEYNITYFTSLTNLTMHIILPIMFILDWVLFYEHGKVKWFYPLLSFIIPLVYVILIFIRAAIIGNTTTATIYPYFFLSVPHLGWSGVIKWIFILLIFFAVLGYIIYFLDNIKRFKKRKNNKNIAK